MQGSTKPHPPCPGQLHQSCSDRGVGAAQDGCHGSVHLSEPAAPRCVEPAFSRDISAHQLLETFQPPCLNKKAAPAAGCKDDEPSASMHWVHRAVGNPCELKPALARTTRNTSHHAPSALRGPRRGPTPRPHSREHIRGDRGDVDEMGATSPRSVFAAKNTPVRFYVSRTQPEVNPNGLVSGIVFHGKETAPS